jgi:hypothetical protein
MSTTREFAANVTNGNSTQTVLVRAYSVDDATRRLYRMGYAGVFNVVAA